MKNALNAARGRLGDDSTDNWGLMFQAMETWPTLLLEHLTEGVHPSGVKDIDGRDVGGQYIFQAPEDEFDLLVSQVMPAAVPSDWDSYMQLMVALATDWGPRFQSMCEHRVHANANVFCLLEGFTGSGKSSCAVRIIKWLMKLSGRPWVARNIAAHTAFDLRDLAKKFPLLVRGDGFIRDEELAATGEGSRTDMSNMKNLQNTLRGSGVHMLICSPEAGEHAAAMLVLRAILYDRVGLKTKFLVIKKGVPLGVVTIPWADKEDYVPYSVQKDVQVDRTMRLQFRAADVLFASAMEMFEDSIFTRVLGNLTKVQKPLVRAMAFSRFASVMNLTKTQLKDAVDLMLGFMEMYPRMQQGEWVQIFGEEPPKEFQRLSMKFFIEQQTAEVAASG